MHGSPWRRVWQRNEGSWVPTASTCIPRCTWVRSDSSPGGRSGSTEKGPADRSGDALLKRAFHGASCQESGQDRSEGAAQVPGTAPSRLCPKAPRLCGTGPGPPCSTQGHGVPTSAPARTSTMESLTVVGAKCL